MGAIAQLSQATVDVEPGRTATFAIRARNGGTVVDRFSFEALGTAAPWVTFAPQTLSLFPEASGTVHIMVAPPRHPSATAGAVPLGIRVSSAEDPAGSSVEETTVNVAPFSDIVMELVPRVTRGRVRGRTQLAVDNRSNCAYRAELSGTDPQAQLAFGFRPAIVDVMAGAAAFVKVGIRPRRPFWRGLEKTVPFRLTLTSDPVAIPARGQTAPADAGVAAQPGPGGLTGAAPPAGATLSTATAIAPSRPPAPHAEAISTEGSMLQRPLLPRWLVGLVAALVGLAVLLVILWYAMFRPQIRSTAQNEVNHQLAAKGVTPVSAAGLAKSGRSSGGSSPASAQTPTGHAAGSAGGSSRGTSAGAAASHSGSGGASSGGSTAVASGDTINRAQQASGNGTFVAFDVPKGRSLQITDLLVENSAGAVGNLTLARNGTPMMQWAMANFRDLDYHWITPTIFGPGTKLQIVVSGCTGACTPAIYYAGHLVSG